MNIKLLKQFLEGLDYYRFANLKEYQDKFYLRKRIQERFPELPDKIIYTAIDTTNLKVKKSFLTRKYILQLSAEILSSFDIFSGNKF